MSRAAVLLALMFTTAAHAASLELSLIGNAGVKVSDGDTTLLVDLPYLPGAFGYMDYDVDTIAATGRIVSVITHRHADHFSASLFMQHAWELLGPTEIAGRMASARIIAMSDEMSVGAFTIRPRRTSHSDTEHYSYLIEWKGRRLYFSGDTDDPTDVLATPVLDVLFITPWLSCLAVDAGPVDSAMTVVYHRAASRSEEVCGDHREMAQGESFTLTGLD